MQTARNLKYLDLVDPMQHAREYLQKNMGLSGDSTALIIHVMLKQVLKHERKDEMEG